MIKQTETVYLLTILMISNNNNNARIFFYVHLLILEFDFINLLNILYLINLVTEISIMVTFLDYSLGFFIYCYFIGTLQIRYEVYQISFGFLFLKVFKKIV